MSKYFCYRCERTQGSCVRMASPQKKTPTTPSKKKTKRPASSSASSTIAFPNIEGFSPKMQKEEQELIAYIHDLSHLKRNRGNTMDYYTMTLQTSSSENQEALLYSLSKRPLLQQSETTRTPVKLKNFTYTHDGQKLVINDMTNISTPQACEYSFQFTKIPRKENVVNVLDVLNSHDEWDMVSLQGKVLSVKEAREVGSPKKRLKLMEAVIADESGSVPLDVWESNIDQIKQGQVYKLNQVQVLVWSARKKLSTTLKTTIVPLEEPSLANIQRNTDTSDDVTTTITEFFSVTNIEKYLKCIHCGRKIIQSTTTDVVKCEYCRHMMRIGNCVKTVSVKVLIGVGDGQVTLTVNEEVLEKVFSDAANMEETELAAKLLSLRNITVTYNSTSLRCSEIHSGEL